MKKNIEKESLDIIHDLRRSVRKLKIIVDELSETLMNNGENEHLLEKLKSDFENEIKHISGFWLENKEKIGD